MIGNRVQSKMQRIPAIFEMARRFSKLKNFFFSAFGASRPLTFSTISLVELEDDDVLLKRGEVMDVGPPFLARDAPPDIWDTRFPVTWNPTD